MAAINGDIGQGNVNTVTSSAPHRRSVPLRGCTLRAVVLAPKAPVADWLGDLDAALTRSPSLLLGKAVILDVRALAAPEAGFDRSALDTLLADLAGRRLGIVGIEGGEAFDRTGLPAFLTGGRPAGEILVPEEPKEEKPGLTSLTIEGSVRSGQTIIHPDGDVTVMGSVSSGAEILAGGSIHVYGALRGRAIAGAARNPRARIYCRKFEPELLGIDRLVRTAEDMGSHLRGQAVQIWLDGSAIKIAALG